MKETPKEKFIRVAKPIYNILRKKHSFTYDRILKELGFKVNKRGIFICDKRKLVIKKSFLCQKNPPEFSIPTIFIHKRVNISKAWLIQPLCEKRRGAYSLLCKKVEDEDEIWEDPGQRNCGFWNNKPVIFDW